MSQNEPNKHFWKLAISKLSTLWKEEQGTLPSTRSDSGTFPEIAEMDENTPAPSLRLEIIGDNGQKSVTIPVSLKNLYAGIVLLEVPIFGFIKDPEAYQGQPAILRVISPKNPESISINGIMTWRYNTTEKVININLRMPDAQSNKLASKVLENWLPAATKELKGFWTLWDKTQASGGAF